MRLRGTIILLLLGLSVLCAQAAHHTRVHGYVIDTDNRGIELVNVVVMADRAADQIGTVTNRNGYYELNIPDRDTIVIVYSMVGYTTVQQRLIRPKEVVQINVEMTTDEQWLEEVEVRGIQHQTGTMEQIDAGVARIMPDATGGSIESILITFAGVNQNNELSSQYNVRGGSFDENQVYVNGIEIHRPLLIRSAQQEGLSFVNPEMAGRVNFSAGGFDARYGDKMASVLDIEYKRPQALEANLSASLLGANLYVGHGDSVYSQMHGVRYKTSQYMLGGLNTTGNYKPNYIDYQTYITRKVGKRKDWTLSLLGNYSQNDYQFQPDSMSESWGGMDNAKDLSIWYDGQEKDRFITGFAALGAHGKVHPEVELGFDLSGFYTNEQERYDITGEYILTNGAHDGENNGLARPGETVSPDASGVDILGTGIFHQHARNSLRAGVATLSTNGQWQRGENTLVWGASAQGEWISDHISEWEWRDSMGYSLPYDPSRIELYYSMRGESRMASTRVQGYVQNTHKWSTDHGQVILNVGGRMQYWTWNREVLPSPRASVVYNPNRKRDVSLRLATGLYYQAPFYKELRDTLTDKYGITRISLNDSLRAQRSVHVVAGGDYYFRVAGRPFKLSAEAYYKYIDRMESYTVDNVRVRYSGRNDSEGYAAGLDLKLYGELVPGADSWVSVSVMRARQHYVNDIEGIGWIPSPQEQRYSVSMLLQDYLPQLPQLRFHLKAIVSDGMPFAAPNNIASQKTFRMPGYKRVDIGAAYIFNRQTAKFMRQPSAKHVKEWSIQLEVFNLVDWRNVNSYFWVNDAYNNQWASPNYLTGRRYNVKVSVDLW